jgi:succinate dehydrogenase / fumarate reductase cytochrome b subunit
MTSKSNALLSSIGTKTLMALSGLALVLFVLMHMAGNLQVFAGPEQLNGYAKKLRDLGPLLWVARGGLLAMFLVHVACALRVNAMNRAARPVPYATMKPQVTSYAARTMLLSGLVVAAFVLYHLLHLTLGVTNPDHAALRTVAGEPDVYAMVVRGFRLWPVSLAYLLAQGVLALHVAHGASSAFQSLGVTHPRLRFLRHGLGTTLAILIFLGNASIPIAVLLGIVGLPAGAP